MAGCRRVRWQSLWVVGQEGDSKEPEGAGAVGTRRTKWFEREGMVGCRRDRWQLLGQWGARRVAGVGVQDGAACDQIRG